MANRILVCRIAWMDFYKGQESRLPHSTAGYVRQYNFGHEAYNFLDCDGRVYGYVEHRGRMSQERLGAPRGADRHEGVTVVWSALRPGGGVFVIGWYVNATVFRNRQKSNDPRRADITKPQAFCDWWATVDSKDAKLLLEPDRTAFGVPDKFVSQSLVRYYDRNPEEQAFRQQLLDFIASDNRAQPVKANPAC